MRCTLELQIINVIIKNVHGPKANLQQHQSLIVHIVTRSQLALQSANLSWLARASRTANTEILGDNVEEEPVGRLAIWQGTAMRHSGREHFCWLVA